MVHRIKDIAHNYRLDSDKLIDFADKNRSKYGVFEDLNCLCTTTWHTDDLVRDFKKFRE